MGTKASKMKGATAKGGETMHFSVIIALAVVPAGGWPFLKP
jgi:hypothetical protein